MDAVSQAVRQHLADGKMVGFRLVEADHPAQDATESTAGKLAVSKTGVSKLGASKMGFSKSR